MASLDPIIGAVLGAVRDEFSDIPDAAQLTRLLLRLLLAALLGGLLGYEREKKGKAAGVRTHMLVAIGAALFVLVPQQAGMTVADLSRVIQGIVTGVGFLGAGAIIKHRDEEDVQGLTTAAGIWMTAAIGVACGLGREATAVVSTVLALVILALLPRLLERPRRAGGGANDER
jgi:putative Mg2+ transporter-C (MgtC) family protein